MLGGGSNLSSPTRDSTAPSSGCSTRGIDCWRIRPRQPDRAACRPASRGTPSWPTRSSTGWPASRRCRGIPGTAAPRRCRTSARTGRSSASRLIAVEFLDYDTGEPGAHPAGELSSATAPRCSSRGARARRGDRAELAEQTAQRPGRLRAAGARPRGAARRPRAARATPGRRSGAARIQGHGARSPADPDSVSAGSFFTNPIVSENFARACQRTLRAGRSRRRSRRRFCRWAPRCARCWLAGDRSTG